MKKNVVLLAGVLLVTVLVTVLGVCMLDADAPDSGSLSTPVESPPPPVESESTPEYTPAAWQLEVAERRANWTVEQRRQLATDCWRLDNCTAVGVTRIAQPDDLTAEQQTLAVDLGAVLYYRTDDGRLLFASGEYQALWGKTCFGYDTDLYFSVGEHGILYYEGILPTTGFLDEVRVRAITVDGAQYGDGSPLEYHLLVQADLEKGDPDDLIGHEEALDALLCQLNWKGFERVTNSNNAAYYTNGQMDVFPGRIATADNTADGMTVYSFLVTASGNYAANNNFELSIYCGDPYEILFQKYLRQDIDRLGIPWPGDE